MMYVKKPIFLYCADIETLAMTAFALRFHPYDVIAAHDGKDLLALAKGEEVALCSGILLHTQQGDPAGRLIHCLLASGSEIPLLLVDRVGDLAPAPRVDMVLYGRNTSLAHILTALKVLCGTRRRAA